MKIKKESEKENIDSKDIVIDCRRCGATPEFTDERCLRCTCDRIRDHDVETITYRSSQDIMYGGDPAKILVRISDLLDSSTAFFGKDGRCRRCKLSAQHMRDQIWTSLSIDNLDELYDELSQLSVRCKDWESCRQRTMEGIQRIRDGLLTISEDCHMSAYKMMGV